MRTRTKLHIPGVSFQLGSLVKDELTGFEGIVTHHVRHITGCDTVWIKSRTELNKDTQEPLERHFDVLRLALLEINPMGITGFPEDVPPAG